MNSDEQAVSDWVLDIAKEWMKYGELPAGADAELPVRASWHYDDRQEWLQLEATDGSGHAKAFKVSVHASEFVPSDVFPSAPEEEPEWVLRTWADVRVGDVVRPPGTDLRFTVAVAAHAPWHVHPAANQYRPNEMPAEWSEVRVRFHEEDSASGGQLRLMNPAAAVEILLAPGEVAAIEALGWENRLAQRSS